ncbi:hypothetical protein UPYG_G00333960 [Umbra pygmaea]|uniref:Sm domain-containing protein n=1 Tax=Umbra pygmaea TaxID=75934 RepID=A0ABD0VWB6_UMBPY
MYPLKDKQINYGYICIQSPYTVQTDSTPIQKVIISLANPLLLKTMSMRTLPLVFINLGGEMLYILDQRLRAQKTTDGNLQKGIWSDEDRKRVMNDIIATMFNKAFMEELLKPQDLYSHRALKTVLTRLAHASVMRLNTASMERLYELMVMAFKHQLLLCPRPRDLLLISKIIEVYTPLSDGEFQLLRQTLLIFLQDIHVRVSLFLKDKVQHPNGRFVLSFTGPVPHGTEVPGLIRLFSRSGKELKRCEFPTEGSYTSSIRVGSFELFGDRVIRIGTNMYSVTTPEESNTSKSYSQKTSEPDPLAKEELNLLARLMGRLEVKNRNTDAEIGFRVNLFATDQEEEEAEASGGNGDKPFEVINIQATQDIQVNTELARIAGEFTDRVEQPDPAEETSDKGQSTARSALPRPKGPMEVSHSIRERTIAENSLVILLQGLQGEVTTVDLRDESTARGRVINVDAFMNVRLEEVLYRDRRGRLSQLADLFITGRNVRYVHIPDHVDIIKTIQTQLEKIRRIRNFAGGKGGKKEFLKKKK